MNRVITDKLICSPINFNHGIRLSLNKPVNNGISLIVNKPAVWRQCLKEEIMSTPDN